MLRCVITRPDIYVINSHTAIAGSQCKGSKVSIFSALRGLKQEQVGPLTPPLHMTCGSWKHPPQGVQWAPIALGAHGSPWLHLTISWSLRIHSAQLIVRTWCWPEVAPRAPARSRVLLRGRSAGTSYPFRMLECAHQRAV